MTIVLTILTPESQIKIMIS